MDEFDPGEAAIANPELLNRYIEAKAVTYEDDAEVISDEALWDIYQQDFGTSTEEHFKKAYKKARTPTHLLRSVLRRAGVFIPMSNKKITVASSMAAVVREEKKHIWTVEDVKALLLELKKGVVTSAEVGEIMKSLESPTPQNKGSPRISIAESNVHDIDTPSRAPRELHTPANPLRNQAARPVRFTDIQRNLTVDSPTAHQFYSNQQTPYPQLPTPTPNQPPAQQFVQGTSMGGYNSGYMGGYQLAQQQVGYNGHTGGYNGFNGGYQSITTNYPLHQPQFPSNPVPGPPSYLQTGHAPYPGYQTPHPPPNAMMTGALLNPGIPGVPQKDASKALTDVEKMLHDSMKYDGSNNFDEKLESFLHVCSRMRVPEQDLPLAFPTMLKGAALKHYIGQTHQSTVGIARDVLIKYFEGPQYQSRNLSVWNNTDMASVAAKYPEKSTYEHLKLLVDELTDLQSGLPAQLQNSHFFRDRLMKACERSTPCQGALLDPPLNLADI